MKIIKFPHEFTDPTEDLPVIHPTLQDAGFVRVDGEYVHFKNDPHTLVLAVPNAPENTQTTAFLARQLVLIMSAVQGMKADYFHYKEITNFRGYSFAICLWWD